MSDSKKSFRLPKNIEHYMAALSKLYANEGQTTLQQIIVNSQIRVHEGSGSIENYNTGTVAYGHALYLGVPESLYLTIVEQRDQLQNEIREGITKIHNIPDEYVDGVFLEMEIVEGGDWRKESGLLLAPKRVIVPEAINRIWGDEEYRVFLSHKTEVKKEAATLKEKLKVYGVSAFVAHEDISPIKEWQAEIENALSSMDSLVALLTDKFHDSIWTDQEVGFAFGRGVPIIPVRLGKDPYGFIGKFQAVSCNWDTAAKEVVKILIKSERMVSAYIRAVQNCFNWTNGNILAEILPFIDKLSRQQTSGLLSAFNSNGEVRNSFGFNGKKPQSYGEGLAVHLSRLTGHTYRFSQSGEIVTTP